MKSRFVPITALTAALTLAVAPALTSGQTKLPEYAMLSKPLSNFTMEDLFFTRGSETAQQEIALAELWIQESERMAELSASRRESARRAVELKRKEIETLKTRLKLAKEAKDVAQAREVETGIKSEEQGIKIVERIIKLSELDVTLARTWQDWASRLESAAKVTLDLEAFRHAPVDTVLQANAEPGLRLDAQGLEMYRKHTWVYRDLAKAFDRVSSDMDGLFKEREKFLEELSKMGLAEVRK